MSIQAVLISKPITGIFIFTGQISASYRRCFYTFFIPNNTKIVCIVARSFQVTIINPQ